MAIDKLPGTAIATGAIGADQIATGGITVADIPSGEIKENQVKKYCIQYEKKIQESGGIDIQLLGIGRTGHIGFNEPGSHFNSKTRLITLDHTTRFDASKSFNGIENVPS